MSIEVPELPGWLQANPYQPIFSDEQLVIHEQLIAETIRTCSVPCILNFGGARYIDCVDCTGGITGPAGAPLAGIVGCSKCNSGQIEVEEEVELCLMVEYQSSRFTKYADIKLDEISVQIMTHVEYCNLLKGAKYIRLNTCDGCCDDKKYRMVGDPLPCGFGRRKAFIIASFESF